MSGSWRDDAAPIISEVITRVGRGDMKALKKAIREAYPYGERSHHPYKIWCSEVRYQLGVKKRFERIPGVKAKRPPAAGQGSLFD